MVGKVSGDGGTLDGRDQGETQPSEAELRVAQAEIAAQINDAAGKEVVLGIDNLIFISILSNKLPEAQRRRARRHP